MDPLPKESPTRDMERLWVALAEARECSRSAGQSIIDVPPPWESTDPSVRSVWGQITHPSRLRELEERARRGLNPLAAEYTRRALEDCRGRSGTGNAPRPKPPWWIIVLIGRRPLRTLARITTLIVVSFVLFKFVLIPIRVKGHSMEPTYRDGAVNLVNRLSYTWSKPRRGDVVAVLMEGKKFMYLKRIIALPGETIAIHQGVVTVNGRRLEEPYIRQRAPWNLEATELRPDVYYVIGDNRTMDQEEHEFGPVTEVGVVGRALF